MSEINLKELESIEDLEIKTEDLEISLDKIENYHSTKSHGH